jgi:ferredoxin--NADP+ reductase
MSRSVAIIGSGPSGCFLAQALLKSAPDLSVDLIDSLPVPYGLVRYGVAPDHQGTKGVIRQFERLFERQGARFVGNMTIGKDVSLDELRAAYDVVVLAAGLSGDKRLGLPGEELDGVYGAGRLTRALNDHPDAQALPKLGTHVVIMGNGNVAIDLVRLFAKMPEELEGSDIGPEATAWLAESRITDIEIIGRSAASQAKFDPVMIRELAKLGGVSIQIVGAGGSDDDEGAKKIAALETLNGHATGPRRVTFRFGLTPVALDGEGGHVTAARFRGGNGETLTLPCTAFITAIGFQAEGTLSRDALIEAAEDASAGVLAPGLYATGWFRRGPRGTIPENRADAQALATRILSDLASKGDARRPGRAALATNHEIVEYGGWKRIDAAETSALPADRCRVKIATRDAMLNLARQTEEQPA